MTVLYLGDIPADPLAVAPPDGLDLADYTLAEASLIAPDGSVVVVDAALGAGAVLIDVGTSSPFNEAGLWRIRIIVSSATARATFPEARIVVDDLNSQWYTVAGAREDWPGSKVSVPDAKLHRLLAIAKGQCLEYAPALPEAVEPVIPADGILEQFTFDKVDRGCTVKGTVSLHVGDIVAVQITVHNPTAAPVNNVSAIVTTDPTYILDGQLEYMAEPTINELWIAAWTNTPGPTFGLGITRSGPLAAGATNSARVVLGLVPGAAPVPPAVVPIPDAWRQAQLVQARNILNAAQASTGQVDPDMTAYEPRPMDWWVKQLLRPESGVPIVG